MDAKMPNEACFDPETGAITWGDQIEVITCRYAITGLGALLNVPGHILSYRDLMQRIKPEYVHTSVISLKYCPPQLILVRRALNDTFKRLGYPWKLRSYRSRAQQLIPWDWSQCGAEP
jgi:hypothetical protein